MKRTPKPALAVLKAVSDGAVSWTHAKGHHWLRTEFLPCLAVGEEEISDAGLLSHCYYVLGDVHDFNGAPLAAIEAYRRSLHWQEDSAAYREIGGMFANVGRYDEAIHNLEIAIQDPADHSAESDLDWVKKCIEKGDSDPLYKRGDKIWECDELLARGDAPAALREVEALEGIEAVKARARCYGAMEDPAAYLSEWGNLSKKEGIFELSWGDWFYMPEVVGEGAEIWRIIKDLLPRMKRDVFISHDSWYNSEILKSLPDAEQYLLLTEYNIAFNSNDIPALTKLVADYPEWEEAKEALAELKAGH